ncbi:MAG: SdpI family protein [Armatimonadota bacterium]
MQSRTKRSLRPILVATAYVMGIMLVLTVLAWIKIPDGQRMVTHSSLNGPDGWSSKPVALLGLPLTILFLAGVFSVLACIEDLSSVKPIVWAAAMSIFVVMQGITVWKAYGNKVDGNAFLLGASGLVFIVIGNYFPKLRRNHFSGIRTLWTLSSELSWYKTHRLGGKLFILYGLVVLVGAFILNIKTLFHVFVVVGLSLALFLMAYSYTIWKSDPNRIRAGG